MCANLSTLPVVCGDMEAVLDTSRFGPGGRSRCILYAGQWITLTHFEEISGKGSSHNWKRSVRFKNRPLIYWIEEGKLQLCSKACCCHLCQGGLPRTPTSARKSNKNIDHESPTEEQEKLEEEMGPEKEQLENVPQMLEPTDQLQPKSPAVVKAQQQQQKQHQEYDSDSGISVSSCTKALNIDTNFYSDEMSAMVQDDNDINKISTNKDNNKNRELDYTTMTQEALLALAKSCGDNGCSQMDVLLYILNTHHPSEDITVVNDKVKTSLKFLTRMGVISKLSIDGNETESEDEENDGNLEKSNVEIQREEGEQQANIKKDSEKIVTDKPEAKTTKSVVEETTLKKKKTLKPKQSNSVAGSKKEDLTKKLEKKPRNKKKKSPKTDQENKKPLSIFSKPKNLSPALATICESKQLCRQEVVKRMWLYVKKNSLQDPNQKTFIVCDEKLKAVTKKKRVAQTELLGVLKSHLSDVV